MKIIILTSSRFGTASYHLPVISNCEGVNVAMVVLCEGERVPKKNVLLQKLRKVRKIGLIGALNGIRMRKWYDLKKNEYLEISDIENICLERKIPFQKVPSINHPKTVEIFNKGEYDLGISLGNGYIAKKIFQSPKNGMINIHHEILPEYQNSQSIIWQLYNESSLTGYTIHKINSSIDKGDILYQEKVPIVFKKSLKKTLKKTISILQAKSSEGLAKVLINFSNYNQSAKPQDNGTTYTTPSIYEYIKIVINYRKLKKMSKF
jgi:methionyl-tRNA formyltransferase